jgi:hypothetical protein
MIELSPGQSAQFESRMLPQLERIQHSALSEQEKLLVIGHIVSGVLDDIRPVYRHSRHVSPSVLPAHDDTTIDRLAHWQKTLRENESLTPAERALCLDQLEHGELIIQREDRPITQPAEDPESDHGYVIDWD